VGLLPLSLGASDRLLNANHDEVYYKGMPMYKGKVAYSINILRMINYFIISVFSFMKGNIYSHLCFHAQVPNYASNIQTSYSEQIGKYSFLDFGVWMFGYQMLLSPMKIINVQMYSISVTYIH
jgi:hypothetical protein